jgi:hypothetical protein
MGFYNAGVGRIKIRLILLSRKFAQNFMNSVRERGRGGPGKSAKNVLTKNLRNLKQQTGIIFCVHPRFRDYHKVAFKNLKIMKILTIFVICGVPV